MIGGMVRPTRPAFADFGRRRTGADERPDGSCALLSLQRGAGNQATTSLLSHPSTAALRGTALGSAAGQLPSLAHLHGMAGNRAVGMLLTPSPVNARPVVQRQAALKSRLGSSPRMVAAHRNSPPLAAADRPEDVALLQSTLAQVGFAPARSRGPFDGFDGIWGGETTKAVARFQEAHGVRPVGGFEAGRKTLSALDPLLGGAPAPPDQKGLPELPDDPQERFEDEPVLEAANHRAATASSLIDIGSAVVADGGASGVVLCDPPANDIDAAVKTAQGASPSFARSLARVVKRGYKIVRGAPKASETNFSQKLIFIACDASQDDAVIRVIYEVNNADNEAIFDDVRDKSKFKTGEEYAKKVIETESITVMHAARMAEEAGRVYSTKIQSLIRPFLQRTPDGLNFKPGTLDKAHKAVFNEMFQNAKTEKGEPGRDAYKKQWENFKKLQQQGKSPQREGADAQPPSALVGGERPVGAVEPQRGDRRRDGGPAPHQQPTLLGKGSIGRAVVDLQVQLNLAGARPALVPDGIFGVRTSNAVAAFQVVSGLEADGIVGPKTRLALETATGRATGERGLEELDRKAGELLDEVRPGGAAAHGALGVTVPSNLKVDTIELVTSGAGAATGYPASEPGCKASLNTPGPFNDTVQGSIVNVHQVHVHMKSGAADQPKVTRLVKRKASAGGQDFDRSGNDGPPPHEFKFPNGPQGDKLVVADAPGWCRRDLDGSRFPLTYSAEFTFAVFDPLNKQVLALLEYHVEILKRSKTDAKAVNSVAVTKKQP